MVQHLNAIVCLVALFLGMFGIQYFVAWPRRSGEIGDQSNQKYDTQDLFEWAMFLGYSMMLSLVFHKKIDSHLNWEKIKIS